MKDVQKEQLTPTQNNNFQTQINTFQKMKDLQTLIKKESALKELCKKIFFYNYFSYKNKRRSQIKN